ncbi:hypothetical protein ACE01N_11565 [Saccharicrinis sp. FJH2]|uniref:hypothetical protein n=1 Tax=Saccharicrinis sp. FJH65 TaxID=3344659 RepID=UPI0035F38306
MKLKILTLISLFFTVFELSYGQYTSSGSSVRSTAGSFVTMDLGFSSPTGAAANFDMDDSWENALGVAGGIYFGMSHNSTLFSISSASVGFYGQFGVQAYGMQKEYEDYGYEVGGLFDNVRIEYEIGPSMTFPINEKINVDAYLKGGLAWVSAPYLSYSYDYSSSIDLGEAFGFVYGLGAKVRLSSFVFGLDINPGKMEFNGDYTNDLSVSNIRFTVGMDLLALKNR